MNKPIVYLAGPIAGCVAAAAFDWRIRAADHLSERGIETLNPMRGKDRLGETPKISRDFRDFEAHGPFYTSRGIMMRDHTDVMRCDALLVNLLGATAPSLGTAMELAWAYTLHKPVVVAIEQSNLHIRHPMIYEALGVQVSSLDEAIDAVAVVLGR